MDWVTQLLNGLSKPLKWWIVIAPWEQGIRVRFGRHTELLRSGIHLRIPLLDRVYRVSCRLRMMTAKALTMATLDQKVATVGFAAQFEVRDARRMFESIANPEGTIMARVRSSIAEAVSRVRQEDLTHQLLHDAAVSDIPAEEWGLGSLDVRITDLAFVRTYRLLSSHEYEEQSGLDAMLRKQETES